MRYRKFGNTGMLVSEIGFGAWAIGGGAMVGSTSIGWGDADDDVSADAIYAALDAGINFFDTADIYGLGHSEQLLGKVLKKQKDVFIASKMGNVVRDEEFTTDYSAKYLYTACEASLRRLQRDVIDYYQLHTARLSHLQQGECMEVMETLQQQGKIRYWGLSLNTFDPGPEFDFLMNQKKGNGYQLVLNILNQKALPILKKSSDQGYGIIARMPLQFGLLTGKFDGGISFPDNDHRKKRLTHEVIEISNRALNPVWHLCKKYNCTKTQLSLSYILAYHEISTVIPGIRSRKQVTDNTGRVIKIDPADLQMIENMGKNEFIPVMNMIQQQG